MHLPTINEILAMLRVVDQWVNDAAEELEKQHPERTAEIEAIRAKLQTAQAMTAELARLAATIEAFRSGKTPVSPDDVDL